MSQTVDAVLEKLCFGLPTSFSFNYNIVLQFHYIWMLKKWCLTECCPGSIYTCCCSGRAVACIWRLTNDSDVRGRTYLCACVQTHAHGCHHHLARTLEVAMTWQRETLRPPTLENNSDELDQVDHVQVISKMSIFGKLKYFCKKSFWLLWIYFFLFFV